MIADDYLRNHGVRYLFEMIAYNNGRSHEAGVIKNKTAIGNNQFLLTNAFQPSVDKFDNYAKLSPTYDQIRTLQDTFIATARQDITTSITFTQPYALPQIIDQMIEQYYITQKGIGKEYFYDNYKKNYPDHRQKEKIKLEQEIKSHLQNYLELMGITANTPLNIAILLPNVRNPNIQSLIKETILEYRKLTYEGMEQESQDYYYRTIEQEIQNTTAQEFIQTHSTIQHPWTTHETHTNLTTRIINIYNTFMTKHYPWFVPLNSNDFYEVERIWIHIQDHITINDNKKEIKRWQQATVDLQAVFKSLSSYTELKSQLLSLQIKDVPASYLWLPDRMATNLDIHPAIRSFIKHIIIRESHTVWRTDIAQTRTYGKMMIEHLWWDIFDIITSEGAPQLRIKTNYLNDNHNLNTIIISAQTLIRNANQIGLSQSDIKKCNNIITLARITKTFNTENTKAEFEESRDKLKSLLSRIIDLSPSWRYDDTDLWLNLAIKLISYPTENHLRYYGKTLQQANQWLPLNKQEVSFIHQHVIKTNQLWLTGWSQAFKTIITTYLLSRMTEEWMIHENQRDWYYDIISQLHEIMKKDPKKHSIKRWLWEKIQNEQRYHDLMTQITNHHNTQPKNPYLSDIVNYLQTNNHIEDIPHYRMLKQKWWFVTEHLFDPEKREEIKEITTYVNEIPESKHGTSALYRYLIFVLSTSTLYLLNRKQTN